MESIHLKTVDPVSQDLLRLAARNGIDLNWERYAKLQPQDGFLRLGLSCPFGCLQGPCRIDPFGRGPENGLCGLGRDEMVAAMLLRICLQGALQLAGETPSDRRPVLAFAGGLREPAAKALKRLGAATLSTGEIFKSAALLERPSAAAGRLLEQALVLSLLTAAMMQEGAEKENERSGAGVQAGYGVMAGADIVIGLGGRMPARLVKELQAAAARKSADTVAIVSLGDWIVAGKDYLSIASSSGEAELLLSSKSVHLLVAGTGVDPGVVAAARRMGIPVAAAEKAADAAKILQAARKFQRSAPRPEIEFTPELKGNGVLAPLSARSGGKRNSKQEAQLALIGGPDSLNFPLGHLAVELAGALRGDGLQVAAWGDAALWMVKGGLASGENENPVQLLDPGMAPLQIFGNAQCSPQRLKGICFTGLKACRDLGVALGLALLGCNVALAEPIPVWGSDAVRSQLSETLSINGGRLTCFDHPVEAQELLEWFAV